MSKNKIVLMSCCAPCSVGAIEQLKTTGADFCVLFYNPNIFPESEYQKRLAEQIKYCESGNIKYAIGNWDHEKWLECVRGMESEPERGKRCAQCFQHRFSFGIQWARENGYNAITSVFGVSKHKNQTQVDNSYPKSESEIKYIQIDWNETLRQEIGKKTDFYRQKYCGCEFSIGN